MKKLSRTERRKELQMLAALPDDQIDTSDIPELAEKELTEMVRGSMFRPVKKTITIRLDADVIAWLKEGGKGYQTKTNALLRREMVRSCQERKGPHRESEVKAIRKGKRQSH